MRDLNRRAVIGLFGGGYARRAVRLISTARLKGKAVRLEAPPTLIALATRVQPTHCVDLGTLAR
jgi:hypothetical protein